MDTEVHLDHDTLATSEYIIKHLPAVFSFTLSLNSISNYLGAGRDRL